MKRASIMITLALSIALSASAQDSRPASLPAAKDHEFNENIPKSFKGQMESYKTGSGTEFKGYVTGPKEAKKALLVIHEWWGLNAHIKATADHFGAIGFRVLAIDLYGGKSAKNPKEAGQLMRGVKGDAARAKLKAALAALEHEGRKIGTIGWCFGGGWSLQAPIQNPDMVQATVIYYGRTETSVDRLKKLKSPVLGIFAKTDGWITPAVVEKFKKALEKAGTKHELHSYDAAHAFANPSGKRFHRPSARDAWKRTLAFFKKNLE